MMKMCRLIAIAALFATGSAILAGCGEPEEPENGRIRISVSVLPQAYLAERVGGEHVLVDALVGQGQSPHTFEPTTQQMARLSRSRLFFAIGLPFETRILNKIADVHTDMKVVDTRRGVETFTIGDLDHSDCDDDDHDHDHDDHDHDPDDIDPHVWMSPRLAKIIARNMRDALLEVDPENAHDYNRNLEALEADLDAVDTRLREALAPYRGRDIMVFHPAFGYFAREYGLSQISVETGGKEPSARQLSALIRRARERNIRVIFVQPQFPQGPAKAIASEIGGAVVEVDPLAYDYLDNLERIADEIKAAFETPAN